VPRQLLAEVGLGDLAARPGGPLPADAAPGLALAIRALLGLADRYYASGDRGLAALHWRSALAVRTARLVYADIGRVLERKHHDPLAGRAVVPGRRKAALVARAATRALAEWAGRARRRFAPAPLEEVPVDDLVRL
jgi:phytoene synthase